MLEGIAAQFPADIDTPTAAAVSAALLGWVAVVYLTMALGARSGELVWSGRYVSRLPTEQRWWSFFYGLGLGASAFVLVDMTGAIGTSLIDTRLLESAGFTVVAFLGVATLLGLAKGSTWERMLFVPITLFGAGLAAWLTFG